MPDQLHSEARAGREIRDILGETLRKERLGAAAEPWDRLHDHHCGPIDFREQYRSRADHLLRLLGDHGIELVVTGEPAEQPQPPAVPVIWRGILADKEDSRAIAKGPAEQWLITSLIGGVERTEATFTLADTFVAAGLVLIDDPDIRKRPGLGKQLAAALEVFRVNAQAMGPSDA